MKICLVSKYPPIEGGISSGTYWLAKGLGERGHHVHVVTNALEVENEYREILETTDPKYSPKNVFIHSTDPSPTIEANPSHIPFSKFYCEKLASLAIETIDEHDVDIIDSWYLMPYCVSGFLAKSFTGVPQIIRHGGSDMQRLYPSPYLNKLLDRVVKSADAIITNDSSRAFFRDMGIPADKIMPLQNVFADMDSFNPNVTPFDLSPYITNQKYSPGIPVFGYIGKITHHLESKGLCNFLKACHTIDKDFLLLFVANGKKMDQFKRKVRDENLEDKSVFLDFVPPWQIPTIMKACTCIVSLEKENSPVYDYHTSALPYEALASGKCVLMSDSVHKKEPYCNLENGKDVLIVNPDDTYEIKKLVKKLIETPEISTNIGKNGYEAIKDHKFFGRHLDQTIALYHSILSK